MDVVVWLRSLGLEEYEAAFRDNKINEQVFPNLTQEDLEEIGVGRLEIYPAAGTDQIDSRRYREGWGQLQVAG
jgi:hypothetical protein